MKLNAPVVCVLITLWAVSLVAGGVVNYLAYCDTDAWLARAQVSADASDMKEYLENCRDGMEKWDLDYGYNSLIPSPKSDLLLIARAIDSCIERAGILDGLSRSSEAYQSGMDDLRGTIRDITADDNYIYAGIWYKGFFLAWMLITYISFGGVFLFWYFTDEL